MSELTTIARPYARAAFELAQHDNKIAQWEQMLDALAGAVTDEVRDSLIHNPRVSKRQVSDALVAGFSDLDERQQQFIRLLAESRRLATINEITKLFRAYRADAEQSIQAEVVSAQALDDAQIHKFQRALAASTGKTVRLHSRVDADLISGALVRAGDRVIDGSLKNRLRSLSAALAQ